MRSAQEIQQIVDDLAYDFAHFQLIHFIQHIVGIIRRPIETKAFPFLPGWSGIWIRTTHRHYIGYGQALHPTHKVHTVLHELGHIVLRHNPQPLHEVLPPEFLQMLNDETALGLYRTLETWHVEPQEIECELFVLLIQQQLMKVRRLKELTGTSSFQALGRYIDAMGYRE